MVVELLLMTGRSLPEVMMMMVPEAWEKNPDMSEAKKALVEVKKVGYKGAWVIAFKNGQKISMKEALKNR